MAAHDVTPVNPATLPLSHLAMFLGLRVNELIVERGHATGFGHFRESHGFVVQHLIEADRTVTELAARMGVTQQGASKVVAEMQAVGLIEVVREADRRVKRIRLSARGWESVRFTRHARRMIERRLSRTVGARRYEHARQVLHECLKTLGGLERIRTRRVRQPT